MSELEQLLREMVKMAQDAHELSTDYPNPYVGIPSPLTKQIIEIQAWLRDAIGEVVSLDIDASRDSERTMHNHPTALGNSQMNPTRHIMSRTPKGEKVVNDAVDNA